MPANSDHGALEDSSRTDERGPRTDGGASDGSSAFWARAWASEVRTRDDAGSEEGSPSSPAKLRGLASPGYTRPAAAAGDPFLAERV